MLSPFFAVELLASLALVDYATIVLYLALMIALGVWFSGSQTSTGEFFFAGRSMSWFPLGMSLMASLISALTYTGIPAQSHEVGIKTLLMPLSVWIILPFIVGWVLPLYHGLKLTSVYEYLELRFDPATRLWASGIFLVWRLLWLGGVIYAPCKVLLIASGSTLPTWPLILLLGLITTLYTCLGGMKAVIWTDVIQGFAMLLGLVVIILGVWFALDGGPSRVTEVARGLGRLSPAEFSFNWQSRWQIWGALPHWVFAMLSFYVADQITAQRFLCASSLAAAKRSYILNCVVLSILMSGLTYVGLCLLAFYHDHPDRLQAKWVTSLDNRPPYQTRLDPHTNQPFLNWDDPAHVLSAQTAEALIAQGRIIRPNTDEPFATAADILNPDTGHIDVEKLVMRKPNREAFRGEIILHPRAGEELLPHFIATELPWGSAGLILAALLAASMSSIDSGLNSICSLLVVDFHQRFSWGTNWLAAWRGKTPAELNDNDRLAMAQPLTGFVGVFATLAAIVVSQIGQVFNVMIDVANTFGAPLLALFLLGLLTRRATGLGVRLAMAMGSLITIWIVLAGRIPWLYPFGTLPNGIWTVLIGTGSTFLLGLLFSLILGRPKTKADLRGLVVGLGQLGVRSIDEEIPLLNPQELATSSGSPTNPSAKSSPHRWS